MGARAAFLVACILLVLFGAPTGAPAQGEPGASTEASAVSGETGVVTGVIADKSTGDPLGDAGVELLGTGRTARTDLNGRYTIRANPGTYDLRIFRASYRSTRLEDVVVVAGDVSRADATLEPIAAAGIEVIEVVAQAGASTESTQLLFRKKALTVSDTLSAEMIKRTPGSTAADLVQRMPAVTVREGDQLVIRGLMERYTSSTLNGSSLPSTDFERRAAPLDLFPADFLESVTVTKTYTPDFPGDFGAGVVEFGLRDAPPALSYSMSLTSGFDTQQTFDDFATYEGSSYDVFGFGKDFRAIPEGTPNPVRDTSPLRFDQGRRFKNIWAVDTDTAPPDFDAKFSVGNTLGPLGFQLGGIFSNGYANRGTEVKRQFRNQGTFEDPDIFLQQDFLSQSSLFNTRLGGLLTSFYKIGWDHKINLRGLVNRLSQDEVTQEIGETNNAPVQQQTAFEYDERQLVFGQLAGEHDFKWFRLDWRSAASQTNFDEPDSRYQTRTGTVEQFEAGQPLSFVESSLGGQRIFNEMEEILSDSALDLTIPFKTWLPFTDVWNDMPGKIKGGWAYLYRDRDFSQRRFRFIADPLFLDLTQPTEDLLAPGNIGPGGVNFIEATFKRDQFTGSETVLAGYGMIELPILRDTLRIVGGVRYEDSDISLSLFESEEAAEPVDRDLPNVNILPGVTLIYNPIEDMNIRLAYSQTLSRPSLRELSPVELPAQAGEAAKVGNPELVQVALTNYDGRWEWFLSPTEVVSFSLFYKELEQPIEAVVLQRASDNVDSFTNADTGKMFGFEFEGRKNLGFLWERLRHLSINTNVTWVDSEVEAPRTSTFQVQTNTKRSLQGQADFTINTYLEYALPDWGTARLLYRTEDDLIDRVGTFGLDDIIKERRDQLDFVLIAPLERFLNVPLSFKLTIKNILNSPVRFVQEGETKDRYTYGVGFGVGLTYSR
jgi:hypothetical protein